MTSQRAKGVYKKNVVSSLLLLELGKFLHFLTTTKLSKSRCYCEREEVHFNEIYYVESILRCCYVPHGNTRSKHVSFFSVVYSFYFLFFYDLFIILFIIEFILVVWVMLNILIERPILCINYILCKLSEVYPLKTLKIYWHMINIKNASVK